MDFAYLVFAMIVPILYGYIMGRNGIDPDEDPDHYIDYEYTEAEYVARVWKQNSEKNQ